MAISNKSGYMLLNTSNKSEASGYGNFMATWQRIISYRGYIQDRCLRLAAFIKRQSIIPENIIKKLPSAELRPGQLDSDSLPDYNILDPILYQYIELHLPADEIDPGKADKELIARILRMINNNEYKRYQAPPVLRVSSKSFGDGRKMPLAAKY